MDSLQRRARHSTRTRDIAAGITCGVAAYVLACIATSWHRGSQGPAGRFSGLVLAVILAVLSVGLVHYRPRIGLVCGTTILLVGAAALVSPRTAMGGYLTAGDPWPLLQYGAWGLLAWCIGAVAVSGSMAHLVSGTYGRYQARHPSAQ